MGKPYNGCMSKPIDTVSKPYMDVPFTYMYSHDSTVLSQAPCNTLYQLLHKQYIMLGLEGNFSQGWNNNLVWEKPN